MGVSQMPHAEPGNVIVVFLTRSIEDVIGGNGLQAILRVPLGQMRVEMRQDDNLHQLLNIANL